MSGAKIHKPGCIANKYWGEDFPPCNCDWKENLKSLLDYKDNFAGLFSVVEEAFIEDLHLRLIEGQEVSVEEAHAVIWLYEHVDKRMTGDNLEKDTIKMIRSVCVDYRDQPALGLVAIETLCKGVK